MIRRAEVWPAFLRSNTALQVRKGYLERKVWPAVPHKQTEQEEENKEEECRTVKDDRGTRFVLETDCRIGSGVLASTPPI